MPPESGGICGRLTQDLPLATQGQPRGKLMVSLVNSHTNAIIIGWHLWEIATRIGWHLWKIDQRFAHGVPLGWEAMRESLSGAGFGGTEIPRS
jgi:hypothetical protein